MIAQESINQLKSLAKLSDIAANYIKLKRENNQYTACCPFHNEKTPSFKIFKQDDGFKCFGCGKSGDIFAFVMESDKCTFYDAVRKVADFYNFQLEEDSKEITIPVARLEKLSPKFIEWFEQRGISNNTLLRFNITEAVEWMPQHNKEVPVICFNYYRDEQLVNIKFRGPQKAFKLAKDAELIFYNLDAINNESTAIIVEGEVDCLSLYEAGIYNVVSVPNGTTPKGEMRLRYLDNCYQYFSDKAKIIIATDNDETGKRLKEELARRFGKDKCYQIEYPEGCKDANDILTKHGTETLKQVINNPKEFPIDGIVSSDSIEAELWEYYRNGYPEGTKVGIEGFDEHIQLIAGQFTTITGAPGSGKSEWVDFMMAKTVINSGWKWAVCSFENTPPVFHATKIIEKLTGKAFDFRKNHADRVSEFELDMVMGFMHNSFKFINTANTDITIDGILSKASELVLRYGVKGLLIDPWNYIEHKIPAGLSETLYISECLTKIKNAALNLGIHIIVIAHPTKLQKDKQTGKYEVPTLYSISGSANFYNKTDNGLTIYRDFETQIVTVYIQKVRYSWLGKIGYVSFTYNTLTRQYQYINN